MIAPVPGQHRDQEYDAQRPAVLDAGREKDGQCKTVSINTTESKM